MSAALASAAASYIAPLAIPTPRVTPVTPIRGGTPLPTTLHESIGGECTTTYGLADLQREVTEFTRLLRSSTFWRLDSSKHQRLLDALFYVAMRVEGSVETHEAAVALLEDAQRQYEEWRVLSPLM